MSKYLFDPESPSGRCVYSFWQSLHKVEDEQVRADRQGRACLRRAQGLTGVVMVPAYHRLLHGFAEALDRETGEKSDAYKNFNQLKLAAIAGLLAHTRHHEPMELDNRHSIAAQMACPKKNSDGPRVSDLRFRRLLQEPDVEALYPMLRRTLALLNGAVDLHLMANDIWYWSERRRRQWAYDYYAVLKPAQRAGTA